MATYYHKIAKIYSKQEKNEEAIKFYDKALMVNRKKQTDKYELSLFDYYYPENVLEILQGKAEVLKSNFFFNKKPKPLRAKHYNI